MTYIIIEIEVETRIENNVKLNKRGKFCITNKNKESRVLKMDYKENGYSREPRKVLSNKISDVSSTKVFVVEKAYFSKETV